MPGPALDGAGGPGTPPRPRLYARRGRPRSERAAAAGAPDPYVYDELALLHAHGDREAGVELEVSQMREPQGRELGSAPARDPERGATVQLGPVHERQHVVRLDDRAWVDPLTLRNAFPPREPGRGEDQPGRLIDVPLRVVQLRVREREHPIARARAGGGPTLIECVSP